MNPDGSIAELAAKKFEHRRIDAAGVEIGAVFEVLIAQKLPECFPHGAIILARGLSLVVTEAPHHRLQSPRPLAGDRDLILRRALAEIQPVQRDELEELCYRVGVIVDAIVEPDVVEAAVARARADDADRPPLAAAPG